jgi:nitric oxide dioxygenase
VIAYASNIENPSVLEAPLRLIAHKHCGLNVQAQHYHIVLDNLMLAIGEVLGAAVTPEVGDAWRAAIHALAETLIGAEAAMYDAAERRAGGWRGWGKFRVVDKIKLSDDVTEFVFVPAAEAHKAKVAADGGFQFTPGQFLTVQGAFGDGGNPRHYTVTSPVGQTHLSCAVKRLRGDANVPDGAVSSWMHDSVNVGSVIELTPPFGDFKHHASTGTATSKDGSGTLLLSGGVGVTPMRAFLAQLKQSASLHNVVAAHQDRAASAHAYASDFAATLPSAHLFRYDTHVSDKGTPAGQLEADELCTLLRNANLNPARTTAYLCGPVSFMEAYSEMLKEKIGINEVHAEVFGPQLATKLAQ